MIPRSFALQALMINDSADDISEFAFDKNYYFPTCILPYNEYFIYVISIGTNWSNLSVTTAWHPEKIPDIGKDGKFIITMMNYRKMWRFFFASGTGVQAQEVQKIENWNELEGHIDKQWDRGYDITDIAISNNIAYVVSSYGLDLDQSWLISPDFPEDKIREYTKEGSLVTDIIRIGDTYLWLFSANTGFNDQKFVYAPDYKDWKRIGDALMNDDKYGGYSLANARIVNGKPLFIFFK